MTFYHTAEDIRIEDNHVLKARLQTAEGEWNDAEIDLNTCIGNDNGNFHWDGEGFANSAENIEFALEGDGDVPVLRATLFDADGNPETRDINLGERIVNNDGNFHYERLLLNNYSYSHRQSKLTMSESTSLASWKLHNRFVDIVRSDASPILDLIPSYNTLEFDYNATGNTVALRIGEYGDSAILAHPNGSVSKRVVRDSKIRKAGTVLEVNRPMSGQFKAIAPFGWSETVQQGITTPMSAPAHALVLMYMHIWVLKTDKEDVDLPIPRYQSLYDALVLIRNALDTELMVPAGQRRVPAEVVAAYQNQAVDMSQPPEKKDVEEE
ncbi:hypothetical protein J4E85_005716 [Alternaria conjuncta]|uniref:uncharacterized protein n=1 Tax=Alternaria conjuncta TaxID=181017 RepID=UPI00221FFF98|nr:uncharacterized protein J4E85_005716 [Alternaria conjuncta]KAI4929092.1 hypothetical protein J4E85_005716 [Alternaria conjuncta]